jgi:hypothetical protein
MDQDALRLLIRRKLASGDLPHDGISRFWGGPPDGEDCDGRADQLVMEGISSTDNQGVQLHVECLYLWDDERDAPGRT